MRQDRRHHLARHLRRQQPVAVLGEHGRDPNRIVDAKPHEPAEHQVVIHLLHQLPLRAHREQDLQKTRPDQAFRRDRRPAEIGIKRLEIGIKAGQCFIHHLPDLAQRVPRGDALFQINIAEQRPARLIRSAHLHPRRCRAEGESCSQTVVEAGLFQQPALMIAVNPLFHKKYIGKAGRWVMWMRKVGDGTETTVEQALIRGLVTA
jgi:hypothetical protein